MSFAREIEEYAASIGDSPPLMAVVGVFGGQSAGYRPASKNKLKKSVKPKLMDWGKARKLLMYERSPNFGDYDCHGITVWTDQSVIFVSIYDGATNICHAPRNPCIHEPRMFGG